MANDPPASPAPAQAASADCSHGFFSRLAAAYREDAQPTDSNAPAPARRAMESPFDSAPFPSAEWQLGGVDYPIGVPNENSQYPLEKSLACTRVGHWMQDNHIEMYGWINPSANLSTSSFTNYPLSYATRPNRIEFNQFLFRLQRVPDTVQTDHLDWGFHFDNLYGFDYHYTTMKGVFSNQLLNHPNANGPLAGKIYGDDPMIWFVDLYIPWVAQGMVVTAGRYLSLPDIEAQFSPNNYLLTHSILYTVDAYTNTGIITTTKLNDQWTLQLGIHGGDDSAVWDDTSRASFQGCVRWVSKSNDDMLYPCVESYNRSRQTYNNLQEFVLTWGHRFTRNVHMLTEAYRIYVRDQPGAPLGKPGYALGEAPPYPAGHNPAFGIVNYFNIELDPKNMVSIRNEFYNDEQGQRTTFATRYSSHTIGLTHWVSQDLEIRPEFRYERAYDFPAYNNGKRNYQVTALVDAILHY
ncbi:outer membrane beta-barrel protein [Dyella sp.]|uniref:outer membrane beta-barrel protein n=1 Tax=Dyella sp. TaxID=1869338 RepID=UPI002ED1CB75